jgi:hypothetical protein
VPAVVHRRFLLPGQLLGVDGDESLDHGMVWIRGSSSVRFVERATEVMDQRTRIKILLLAKIEDLLVGALTRRRNFGTSLQSLGTCVPIIDHSVALSDNDRRSNLP